ncbi:MAG: hypothetical protein GY865_05195, partial [candidate division Zixibacteria bacterium]|nr:hypothetical protein [candidate division Zixibacteria bacterium]
KVFTSDVAEVYKKHHYSKVIYDLRSSSLNMNLVEIDEVPKLIAKMGIDISIKRALVVADDFIKYNFFETTSHNKRLNLKIFKNYSEAEEWLFNNEPFFGQTIPVSKISESE